MKLTIKLIITLLVSSNALLNAMQTPYNPTQLEQRQAYEDELNHPQSLVNCKPENINTDRLYAMARENHLHEYIPRYLDKGVVIPNTVEAEILCYHFLGYSNDDTPALLATFKHIQRKGPALSADTLYRLLELSYDTPTRTQLLLDMANPRLEIDKLTELVISGLYHWCRSVGSCQWKARLATRKKSYKNRLKHCALLINAGAIVPPTEPLVAKFTVFNTTYIPSLLRDFRQLKELNVLLPFFHQNHRLFFNTLPGELLKELKSFLFEMLTTRTVSDWWRTSGYELEEKNQLARIATTK